MPRPFEHRIGLPAAALVLSLLAGCGSEMVTAGEPAPTTTPGAGAVEGITRFTTDLYAVAAEPGANTLFSPVSIAYAFAMLRAGARGETAAQLDAAFGFPADVVGAYARLRDGVVTPGPLPSMAPRDSDEGIIGSPGIVRLAAALFPQAGYPIERPYLDTVAERFRGELAAVNFADAPGAVARVNRWVQSATGGRIPQILDSHDVDDLTRFVLVDAVYLKADWEMWFLHEDDPMDFTLAGGRKAPVDTMSLEYEFGYARGDGWESVEIPYRDRRPAMRILLPGPGRSPADLMTPEILAAAGRTTTAPMELFMPSWRFGTELDLEALLRRLGVTAPFDRADLSGITKEPEVFISKAIHRADISVDQLGTEATAATALIGQAESDTSLGMPQVLHVDRPFAFAIVDTATDAPLFVGSVADPRAS